MALTTNYLASTSTTTSGTKTVTATPSLNDLVIMWTAHTGNTSATPPTDDNGGTYSLIGSALATTGGTKTVRAWVRDQPFSPSVSTIFSHAPGTTSGGGILVGRVIGVSKVGIDAIRQFASQNDQAGGTTPAPVFGAAARTENALFGFLMNDSNPANLTQPSGWTESNDQGYATPTTGFYACRISGGEANTTITWGSTSATVFCSAVFEVDATQVAATGLSTETDTSLALSRVQIIAAGLATVSETALALGSARPAGLASETDSAFALAAGAGSPVGLASETDAALALAATQSLAVGLTSEADTGFALAGVQIKSVGLASESDSASALGSARPAGTSAETETALALTSTAGASVGLAAESDTALALGVARPVGLSAETDAALALLPVQIIAAGLAATNDNAIARAAVQIAGAGRADETDAALTLPSGQSGAVGLAAENDNALALGGAGTDPRTPPSRQFRSGDHPGFSASGNRAFRAPNERARAA